MAKDGEKRRDLKKNAQKRIHNKTVAMKQSASRKRKESSPRRMTVMHLRRSLRKGGATSMNVFV
jgi:hypothetical protein